MRFSTVFVCSALAALASATPATHSFQSRALPNCAVSCVTENNPSACSATDNVCLCNNKEFLYTTTNCIENACAHADITSGLEEVKAICGSVGVPLTFPISI
ncbi:hypothetical protein D9758_013554 [Tetrapyrgos nigripes]|uniref:CFEM domain-containing protein n=1 Tax=Tetrapyrgos nigripes TaxID=182062 RepID=A0A8H5CGQ0_9AGAR|nr:hypothetical protein D9758_013554 [Tetrapyrgos nigripes]